MTQDFSVKMPPYPDGEPGFVDMLKRHEPFIPSWDRNFTPQEDEIDLLAGIFLETNFPDDKGLLDTAYADFRRFLEEGGLTGNAIPLRTRQCQGMQKEEYRLVVEESLILLEAGDTEGIRRGIYFLMDEITAKPYLKMGSTTRKPWLKNRISRCFFGPIKRPPFNIDELMNDIDYYPEEYLGKLAREGVNGLWLTITFREICDTSIRTALPDAARRLAKLRKTVERCRRYGIKVWAFCIEPAYWSNAIANPVPADHEELLGAEMELTSHCFCINSSTAKKYLHDCTYSLFKSVPHLGGLMMISLGERATSCLSKISLFGDGTISCSKRCNLSIGEIYSQLLSSMKQGMEEANPEAELISWAYIPYAEQISNWILQLPSRLTDDIIMAFNFESGLTQRQLGKVHAGGDYWHSKVGPSDRFITMVEAAKGHCQFAAKLQVGCSHECATVPYIPVPSILYRKYREMHKLGVQHVLQCWYFGNYPGLMNAAAGKLAYEDFSSGEDAFLERLARQFWGGDWKHAVQAWKLFSDGYSNYPLDIQFQYYGPMHDGPTWPLHLRQTMTPLARTWKPELFPSGDAVGEAMNHFQLDELVELTGTMAQQWSQGLNELKKAKHDKQHELDFTLAEALDIQFHSGHNILRFYSLRNRVLDNPSNAVALIDAMKGIVRNEKAASLRLAELCRLDRRLGYHSEAEVYKYFPEKLEWRASQLEYLLAVEFPELETAIANGIAPGQHLRWNGPTTKEGQTHEQNGIRWNFETKGEKLFFHLDFTSNADNPETAFIFFYDSKGAKPLPQQFVLKRSDCEKTDHGWRANIEISSHALLLEDSFFFGVEKVEYLPDGKGIHTNDKPGDFFHEVRLRLYIASPDKTTRVQL
ncbi:MAG: hypothetical protein IJS08_12565 [Victivallales bacterium]|nr:hypothetical protein [Victivallales bacterium]